MHDLPRAPLYEMNAAEGPAPRARSGVLLYAVAVAVLALDQLTKALIVLAYQVGDSVPVVGSVLFFTRRTNTGGAFSVLQDSPVLLSVISAAVLLLIVTAGPRFAGSVPGALCALGLVAGGAAGNLLDRIRLGHVVDFIDLRVWPVFNVADIAITVGAALLLISALRAERR